jgi:protein-L-isoaspartate(D-aspartate) O-methyltransferase
LENWTRLRKDMVEKQLRRRGIRDERVLAAMELVPRHEFVPEACRASAYADEPLPIGAGQTISQPYMVAAMCEALELDGTERVLEIGTGSGYHAAVLAELAREVFTVEREPYLVEVAWQNLARLGYSEVTVVEGDGSLGYPERAPYQGISVAAGAPDVPHRLLEQLEDQNGRLVIPVGSLDDQELRLVRKRDGQVASRVVNFCRFVPLRGAFAWRLE